MWSGSEGGVIKAWPWNALEKALSFNMEERHIAALVVERSYVDLRSLVTVNGMCSLPAADVKYMASDNCKSKVWTGTSLSFALWYVHNYICDISSDNCLHTLVGAGKDFPA